MNSTLAISKNDLNILTRIFVIMLITLLVYLSIKDYLIFHSVIELFSACIGFGIGLIAINSYNYYRNNFFSCLAISFFFIGIIELLHTIVYMMCSMNDNKVVYYTNLYIQLSASAKFMRIISFLIALKAIKKKINLIKIGSMYLLITIGLYFFIFVFKMFPRCYIEFQQVTNFKISMNFVLIGLNLYTIYVLQKNKSQFKSKVYKLLFWYMLFLGFSDVVYVVYISNYNISDLIAHYLKFISFCILYSVVIKITLKDPYESIFTELNRKAVEMEKLNDELRMKNIELEKSKYSIRRSKEKYRKILELLPDAVVVRQVENMKIEYVNSAFVRLFRFNSKKDIINKNVMKVVPKKGHEVLKKKMKESSQNSFIPFKEETLFTAEGDPVKTEVSTISLDLDNNKYVMNMIRNLEERNQYERLKLELEERDNLRIEFFANICHELRTPINVIYSALQLQNLYIKNNDVDKMNKYNNICEQNCYRLLKLCNNLIDINKLDSGFIKPNMKYCNIVELVENITESVTPYVKNKNLNIIFDTNTEEKYMYCDLNFMERILLNLLSNAIKFSVENGIIGVNIIDNKNEVIIVVKDNGIGIPESKQKVIFERFIQADKSFSRQSEGSGIGLSLVKSFVEIQGGTIECESIEGKGTDFIIRLPVTKELEESAAILEESEISSYKTGNTVCLEFSDIYFD